MRSYTRRYSIVRRRRKNCIHVTDAAKGLERKEGMRAGKRRVENIQTVADAEIFSMAEKTTTAAALGAITGPKQLARFLTVCVGLGVACKGTGFELR